MSCTCPAAPSVVFSCVVFCYIAVTTPLTHFSRARQVRYIHIHWYMLMESGALCHANGAPMQLLSEWTDKEPFKRWAKDKCQRVSSHFKCFTHESLVRCFGPASTEVLVHKHCLHAFNFVVKARFDDLVAATGYIAGPHPDDFGSVYAKKDLEPALVFNPSRPELYLSVNAPIVVQHAGAGFNLSGGGSHPHPLPLAAAPAVAARKRGRTATATAPEPEARYVARKRLPDSHGAAAAERRHGEPLLSPKTTSAAAAMAMLQHEAFEKKRESKLLL